MKVLILGVDGMIGHKIAHYLEDHFDLTGTSRKKLSGLDIGLKKIRIINIDLFYNDYKKLLKENNPDIIINSAGITTRRGIDQRLDEARYINNLLPISLAHWVKKHNKKLIHFSTDCVFSGKKGNYLDEDIPDAEDLYGKLKGMGEVHNSNTLIIRCSMIGREIFNHTELFEWLNSMKDKQVEGFSNVIFSGVTTSWMGNTLNDILKHNFDLSGIYNISSQPISKYDLITKLSRAFNLNIDIIKNINIKSNKVLNSKKFTEITGINCPSWDTLIDQFVEDNNNYISLYKN